MTPLPNHQGDLNFSDQFAAISASPLFNEDETLTHLRRKSLGMAAAAAAAAHAAARRSMGGGAVASAEAEDVASEAFDDIASVFGASTRKLSVEPTPHMSSPPRSVHRSHRAGRESMLSEPLSTPSLGGSPPKSIGKVMLTRSRGRSDVHDEHATPEMEDTSMFNRADAGPTPELRSPPKSLRKGPRSGALSGGAPRSGAPTSGAPTSGAPTTGGGGGMPDTADADGGFDAAADDDDATLVSPPPQPKWEVAPATPVSGHQLRLTPARQSRAHRDPGGYLSANGGSYAEQHARASAKKSSARKSCLKSSSRVQPAECSSRGSQSGGAHSLGVTMVGDVWGFAAGSSRLLWRRLPRTPWASWTGSWVMPRPSPTAEWRLRIARCVCVGAAGCI